MNLISINNLNKTFGSGHTQIRAIKELSLDVKAGEVVLIMGPSGSGKTTLVSMIGTLMRPTGGRVVIDSQDVTQLGAAQLSDFRLHTLGFVFQSFNLLAALNAEENVMIPLLAAGVHNAAARAKARTMLKKLGMGERLSHQPRDLSGGEKQRVAVARALINEPKIILADEPTANLDSKTGQEVTALLCSIACAEGKAVIIVSHDSRLKAVAMRVITVEDGKITGETAGGHDETCPHHGKRA